MATSSLCRRCTDHDGGDGNGIRRYRRRPASDERSYRNLQRIVWIRRARSIRAAEHEPSGRSDLAVPEPGAISHHVPEPVVPEPVVPEPASRPIRRNDRSRDCVGPGRRRDSGYGTGCLPAGGRGGQPGLRNHVAAARRHRPGGVEPRAICRRGPAQRRPVHPADHWHPARRVAQRRCPRHRRRASRRGPYLQPRGRADAVHPIDVGGLPRRRQRRRPIRPVQHL